MKAGFRYRTVVAVCAAMLVTGVSGFAAAQGNEPALNGSDLRFGAAPAGATANTLTGVLVDVVSSNPEVRAKWSKMQSALEEVNVAQGDYLPQVDVKAGMGYLSRENDGRGSYDTRFARLELTQMLYHGGFVVNEVQRLSHASLVRYYELLDTAQNITLETVKAYLGVRRYRKLVRLARHNYQTHLKIYNQIKDRVQAGVGAIANLQQITGRLALAKSNLMTAGANLHDVRVRYQRLTGHMPPRGLAPAPRMDADIPETSGKAVLQAISENPAFHAALENIKAASAREERAMSAFLPKLDLKAHVGTGNDNVFGENRDEAAVQLVLSMNLFNGGSDVAARDKAQALVMEAKYKRRTQCVNLRQKTLIAYNDIREIMQQLDVLRQHKLSSGRVLEAYRQQFRIGKRTLLDVLDSQNEYFESHRAYVNAQYDLKQAYARTQAATGHLMVIAGIQRGALPTLAEVDGSPLVYNPRAFCKVARDTGFTFAELAGQVAERPVEQPDFVMSGDALFASGKYRLSAAAQQHLQKVLDRINSANDVQGVLVSGYTDSVGSEVYNKQLSEQRARSVARYLAAHGVDSSLIVIRGYGESDPVESNMSVAGRRANRRVEVTLQDKGAA